MDPSIAPAGPAPVLVLNTGSSSLKYQLVVPETEQVQASGLVERIGEPGSRGGRPPRGAPAVVAERLAAEGIDLETVRLRRRRPPGRPRRTRLQRPRRHRRRRRRTRSTTSRSSLPCTTPAPSSGSRPRASASTCRTSRSSTPPSSARSPRRPRPTRSRPSCPGEHRIRRYGFHGTSHQFVSEAAAVARRPAARRAQPGRPAPRQRRLGLGHPRRSGGRHLDGSDPAAGARHGHPLRRHRPGPARLPLPHARARRRRDRRPAQHARPGIKGLTGEQRLPRARPTPDGRGTRPRSLATDVYVHRLRHYVGAYLAVLGRVDLLVFTAGDRGERHRHPGRPRRRARGPRLQRRPGPQRRAVQAGEGHLAGRLAGHGAWSCRPTRSWRSPGRRRRLVDGLV